MADLLRSAFLRECRALGIHPEPRVLEQLVDHALDNQKAKGKWQTRPGSPTAMATRLDQTVLNLGGQALDRKSILALSNVLKSDCFFRTIILADAYLNEDGTTSICNALRNNTFLVHLDLRGNNVQLEGGVAIGAYLKHTATLEELVLEWNSIGLWDNAIAAIGDGLAINTSLRYLDLRNNKIGPSGTQRLTQGLKVNQTLLALDLRWNNCGHLGGLALADLFQFNSTLTSLELLGNDISDSVLRTIHLALDRNQRQSRSARDAIRLHDALAGANLAHADTLASLHREVAAKDSEISRLHGELADQASSVKAAKAEVKAAKEETARVVRERDVQTKHARQAEEQLDAARESHANSERVLRATIAEWQRKALEWESKQDKAIAERDAAREEVAMLNRDIERRRERERKLVLEKEIELEELRRSADDKAVAIETKKDQELAKAIANLHRKLDDSETKLAEKDHDMRAMREQHEEEKRVLQRKIEDAEIKAKSNQWSKLKGLEEEVTALKS
ncbi:hypothetical protein BCR44DRAFT_138996, partial [Catenaria anguillulae PL171]